MRGMKAHIFFVGFAFIAALQSLSYAKAFAVRGSEFARSPATGDSPGDPNRWADRIAGINVPGGVASVVGSQSFDTFPVADKQQYFQLYDPSSIATDCRVKADGCSLKFSILRGYQQGEPGWFDWNFSPDLSKTFGEGQEFYVQYRERLDSGMLDPDNFVGSGLGWKQDIVTEGDASTRRARDCSNSPGEVVTGNSGTYPITYSNCGFSSGSYHFMKQGYEGIQLSGVANTNFLDQNAAGCPHYAGRGIPTSDPTCWKYVANEWMTVQIHIRVGQFNQPNSIIEVWFAHEGRPAQLVTNAVDAAIINDGSGASGRYGKINLSAYTTGKTNTLRDTAVWFDDLMVATRRIPDPNVATPNAPDDLRLSNFTSRSVTVNWRVNSQNKTAQDDDGFLIERCKGDGADCFPNPQSSFKEIGKTPAGVGHYVDRSAISGSTVTYRVRAKNFAGFSAYAIAQCFNGGPSCGGAAMVP